LPSHTVGFGFGRISEGGIPEGVSPEDILRSDAAVNKVITDSVFKDPAWKDLEIKGNQHFYAGRYSEAIDFYKQAIEMGKTQLATDQNRNIFLLQIYNMHAECSIRIGDVDHAFHNLEEVLNLAYGIERVDHRGLRNYWLTNATVGKGLLLLQKGDVLAAEALFRSAVDTASAIAHMDASLFKKLQAVAVHFQKAGKENDVALFKKYLSNRADAPA